MTLRVTRKKKVVTTYIGNHILKMRLFPWLKSKNGRVWRASMAISKSNRQLNDWNTVKKNKRTRQLSSSMTGKFGPKTQAIAIRQVRNWITEIPKGDSITIKCECTLSEKQFKVWKKWFLKNESKQWHISDNHKAFFYYNST